MGVPEELFAYAALALALSLDSLAVGLLYGMRGIRLSLPGSAVVCLTSAVVLAAAAITGQALARSMDTTWAQRIGALVLVLVGIWAVAQAWRTTHPAGPASVSLAPERPRDGQQQKLVLTWRLPALRLVIQILREPAAADLDRSGSISSGEAVLLGLALAADSLAAGLGAGLTGFHPLPLAIMVGGAGWLSLLTATRLAASLPWRPRGRWALVHGLALVALGLYRLF